VNKLIGSAEEAIRDIPDGATVMAGGFGLCGNPENLIAALHARGTRDLTVISNNCGTTDKGLGVLLANGQVRKMVSSYVGENKEFERRYLTGELEVELVPQGTLAERIRAGGAGIPAFYTPTGVGTQVAEGGLPMRYDRDGAVVKASPKKETREFGGRTYVLETGLFADYCIVRAFKADTHGNLVFRKTARNFSPMMCTAAKVTIVEAEHVVQPGELDPDQVHVPGVFVQRVVQGAGYEKPIEQRTVRPRPAA
jgi:3-oxoacid CoA-transferase subunit A